MSITIKKHPAERFLDWFPHNTKLFIRGERGKNRHELNDLYKELFDQLVPWCEMIMQEVRDGEYE